MLFSTVEKGLLVCWPVLEECYVGYITFFSKFAQFCTRLNGRDNSYSTNYGQKKVHK
jgi:hypothetical protein